MKIDKTKTLKALLAIFAFLLIVFGSEFIYLAKNKPQSLGAYFLYLSKYMAKKGNIDKSLAFLEKGGSLAIYFNSLKLEGKIPKKYSTSIHLNSSELKEKYSRFISEINAFNVVSLNGTDLSQVYYDLALLSYSSNEIELSKVFLTYAIYLNPELSHYHVELANLYLTEGNIIETKSVLERCQKFDYPKIHCTQYQDTNLLYGSTYPVGFLKVDVEKHYKSL